MSSKGTSREHCIQGKEHAHAFRQREIYGLLQDEGSLTSKEIADEVGVEQNGIRTMLQRLRRDGHVEKRPDPFNPVAFLYEVTDDE